MFAMFAKKQTSVVTSIVDDAVLQYSSVARLGQQCINAASIIRMVQPVAVLVATGLFTIVAFVDPALAQQANANLGGNSSNPINAFRTALNIGVWALLGLGIFGVGWGIYNIMFGMAWGRQMIGGAGALGFAGVVALVNDIINDTPPTLPSY